MSTDLMPDFVTALEVRLRADAEASGRSARRAGARRRGNVLALATLLVALAIAAAAGLFDRTSQRAYADDVALLRTPPVDLVDDPRARAAVRAMKPIDQLDRVWSVPAFGGTAYLAHGDDRWCLSAPDPATSQPDIERGATCTDDDLFARRGISLGIGNNVLAVVPDDAPRPTLREPGRAVRALTPTAHGVLVLPELPEGSVVTLFDRDGRMRSHRISSGPQVPFRRLRCPDGDVMLVPLDKPARRCPRPQTGGT